jgi:16S rRNA pseudouridine516 synthase
VRAARTRLDRFISAHSGVPRREVRLLLAQGRISVDGSPGISINQPIGEFSRVELDQQVLQANAPVYLMLHKPTGIVSATRDDRHHTVIDLLERPDRSSLHIVGRLDINSSGLLLLTNDGRWSRQLSAPQANIYKHYRVTVERPLDAGYIEAFARGMYFDYEGITTRPAGLRIISEHVAEVALVEGRYRQIRRMFGRFDNRVLALHRFAVGNLQLDPTLQPGHSRELTGRELDDINAGRDGARQRTGE